MTDVVLHSAEGYGRPEEGRHGGGLDCPDYKSSAAIKELDGERSTAAGENEARMKMVFEKREPVHIGAL